MGHTAVFIDGRRTVLSGADAAMVRALMHALPDARTVEVGHVELHTRHGRVQAAVHKLLAPEPRT